MAEAGLGRFVLLLAVGLAMVGLGGYVLSGEVSKELSGVLIGGGSGLFGMCLSRITIIMIRRKNPNYEKKVRIEEQDERNQAINHRAKASAFDAMGYIYGVTMLICVLTGAEIATILLLAASFLLIYGVYMYQMVQWSKRL